MAGKNSVFRVNSMADFEALKNRTKDRGKALSYNPVGQNPPNKFNAVICEADGIKFRSKNDGPKKNKRM